MVEIALDYLVSVDDGSSADLWTSKAHAVIFATDVLIDVLRGMTNTPSSNTAVQWSLAAHVPVIRESASHVGKCPSLAWRLFPSSVTWLHILSEYPSEGERNHLNCTARKCRQNDVDPNCYKTRHVDTCAGCSWVRTDQKIVREAIIEGKIPLVCCYADRHGHIKLETVKDDLGVEFCAISHVWSGGLGNFKDNAIPYCQLLRLKIIIDNLPPSPVHTFDYPGGALLLKWIVDPVQNAQRFLRPNRRTYFWLDSLCIPVADDQKLLRQKSIDSMGQIYAGATKILVLDPILEQTASRIPPGDISTTNLCISSSPWMSRSWPLQEGAISLSLFVKFRDSCELLDRYRKRDVGLPGVTMDDLDSPDSGIVNEESERINKRKARLFDRTWNALVTRSTTKSDDLHGIIAALCNLSTSEILELPRDQRLKAIIKSQSSIPLVMLYEHSETSSNTTSESCLWDPQLPGFHRASRFMDRNYGVLKVTEAGFKVDSLGESFALLIHAGTRIPATFVVELPDSGRRYKIRLGRDDESLDQKSRSLPKMLILSRRRIFGLAVFQGAQFLVQAMGANGMSVKFESSLTWRDAKSTLLEFDEVEVPCRYLEESEDPNFDILIQEGKLDPHYPSLFFSSRSSAENFMLLDVYCWHNPKWGRESVFPFSTISQKYFLSLIWSASRPSLSSGFLFSMAMSVGTGITGPTCLSISEASPSFQPSS